MHYMCIGAPALSPRQPTTSKDSDLDYVFEESSEDEAEEESAAIGQSTHKPAAAKPAEAAAERASRRPRLSSVPDLPKAYVAGGTPEAPWGGGKGGRGGLGSRGPSKKNKVSESRVSSEAAATAFGGAAAVQPSEGQLRQLLHKLTTCVTHYVTQSCLV